MNAKLLLPILIIFSQSFGLVLSHDTVDIYKEGNPGGIYPYAVLYNLSVDTVWIDSVSFEYDPTVMEDLFIFKNAYSYHDSIWDFNRIVISGRSPGTYEARTSKGRFFVPPKDSLHIYQIEFNNASLGSNWPNSNTVFHYAKITFITSNNQDLSFYLKYFYEGLTSSNTFESLNGFLNYLRKKTRIQRERSKARKN